MNHVPFGFIVPGVGTVRGLLEIYSEDGRVICGVYKLLGWINLPPKQWLKRVRETMRDIEDIARECGAAEIRIAGRDWSRVLPDYQPFADVQNGLRKVL